MSTQERGGKVGWGREVFCSSMIRFQSFMEPVPLDCVIFTHFSDFLSPGPH